MAAEMEDDSITRPHSLYQLYQTLADISAGGLARTRIVIDKLKDFVVTETEVLHQQHTHSIHIVHTSLQLTLRSRVIAPYKQSSLDHDNSSSYSSSYSSYSSCSFLV
jgi:hypothetical protein